MRELNEKEMELVSGGCGGGGRRHRSSCQPKPACQPKPPCGGTPPGGVDD